MCILKHSEKYKSEQIYIYNATGHHLVNLPTFVFLITFPGTHTIDFQELTQTLETIGMKKNQNMAFTSKGMK